MKTISELTDFYYENLYPPLQILEDKRKRLKKKILLYGSIFTSACALILLYLFSINASDDFLFGVLIVYSIVLGIGYKFLIKDYTSEFKAKIIEPLIKALDPQLHYKPLEHIKSYRFEHSKLFTSKPDRVSGNDYVSGSIDGIPIEFSDFHAEKKHKSTKGKTTWSTIFKGLFIVSEFNKNFQGTTVVLPDTAQSSFGDFIGGWLQSNNFSRDELVKMDNPEFEKEFVVYATDQIEARYILTHTLMQRLLNYKKRAKTPLYISFSAKNINLAIEYNKDLFEPSIFHSLLEYKIAMEYVKTLHLAIGVVEELKLNQKLWSKL